jgi:hypothetical protein
MNIHNMNIHNVQFNEVKFINLSPKGGSFSMVLDTTLNGENMRF